VGAFDNEVEEQYVQIEHRLAKVDTIHEWRRAFLISGSTSSTQILI